MTEGVLRHTSTQSGQAGKVVDVRLGLYKLLPLLCFVLGPVGVSEARHRMRVQPRLLRSSLSVRQDDDNCVQIAHEAGATSIVPHRLRFCIRHGSLNHRTGLMKR